MYRSRGVHHLGPQADCPKLPTVYCCMTQFHHEIGQKSSFSTTGVMAFFHIFTPRFGKLRRRLLPYHLLGCSPYSSLSDSKVISNSDDQIFSSRGLNSQNLPHPQCFLGQVVVWGGPLVRCRGGFNQVSDSCPNDVLEIGRNLMRSCNTAMYTLFTQYLQERRNVKQKIVASVLSADHCPLRLATKFCPRARAQQAFI